MMAKFDNVPPDVLQEYLDGSAQLAGETDDHWAMRNRMAEEKLMALYPEHHENEPR